MLDMLGFHYDAASTVVLNPDCKLIVWAGQFYDLVSDDFQLRFKLVHRLDLSAFLIWVYTCSTVSLTG